jgi:hypothetical protein
MTPTNRNDGGISLHKDGDGLQNDRLFPGDCCRTKQRKQDERVAERTDGGRATWHRKPCAAVISIIVESFAKKLGLVWNTSSFLLKVSRGGRCRTSPENTFSLRRMERIRLTPSSVAKAIQESFRPPTKREESPINKLVAICPTLAQVKKLHYFTAR